MKRSHLILAEVGLITVVAWTTALGMLAHATGSGPHQWADWGAVGTGMALLLLVVLGGGCWIDSVLHCRRSRPEVPARPAARGQSGRTRRRPDPTGAAPGTADGDLFDEYDSFLAEAYRASEVAA